MQSQTQVDESLLGGGENANKTASELFAMALPQEVKLDYYAMEEPWTLQRNPYSAPAVGSPVAVAKKVMDYLSRPSAER